MEEERDYLQRVAASVMRDTRESIGAGLERWSCSSLDDASVRPPFLLGGSGRAGYRRRDGISRGMFPKSASAL